MPAKLFGGKMANKLKKSANNEKTEGAIASTANFVVERIYALP